MEALAFISPKEVTPLRVLPHQGFMWGGTVTHTPGLTNLSDSLHTSEGTSGCGTFPVAVSSSWGLEWGVCRDAM